MSERKTYVWYSPRSNAIKLMPLAECREYKSCRWDKCYFVSNEDLKNPFFFIGEL